MNLSPVLMTFVCVVVAAFSGLAHANDVTIERFIDGSKKKVLTAIVQVKDKHDEPDMGIRGEDFEVDIDGVREELTSVKRFEDASLPFKTILLIDTSCSMKDSMGKVHDAARRYVAGMSATDEAIIAQFNDDVYGLNVAWSSSKSTLLENIDDLKAQGTKTLFYDALNEAVELGQAHPNEMVTILVLSDGKDEGSKLTLERATRTAKEQEVRIGTVGYVVDPKDDHTPILKGLSKDTKGRFAPAKNKFQIETAFEKAQRAIHQLWVLEITTGPIEAPMERKITVTVTPGGTAKDDVLRADEDTKSHHFADDWQGSDELAESLFSSGFFFGLAILIWVIIVFVLVALWTRRRARASREQMEARVAEAQSQADATLRAQADTQAKLEALTQQVAEQQTEIVEVADVPSEIPLVEAEPARSRKTRFHDPSVQRFVLRLFDDGKPLGMVDLGAMGDTLTLGSDPSRAAITLEHETVSGLHAQLQLVDAGAVIVTDLGSSNGTYVNGVDVRTAGPSQAYPGQLIQLGLLQTVVELQ